MSGERKFDGGEENLESVKLQLLIPIKKTWELEN